MEKMLVAVFDNESKAYEGSRALAQLDADGNIAVHAQYEGIPRLEGRRAGDIRMFTRADMGWIWLIPISGSVTSVGAVIPQSVHRRESKGVPEDSLIHYLTGTAGLPLVPQHRRQPVQHLTMPTDVFRHVVDVNLYGVLFSNRAVARSRRRTG